MSNKLLDDLLDFLDETAMVLKDEIRGQEARSLADRIRGGEAHALACDREHVEDLECTCGDSSARRGGEHYSSCPFGDLERYVR